jgi:hypothetical protein
MRLKVRDEKSYKGKPEKGDPMLEIPLRNGLYAKPGQVFGADAVLGGQDTLEGLLKEKPCRVTLVSDDADGGKGAKADLKNAIKAKQDADEKLRVCEEALEESKMETEDANKEIEDLRAKVAELESAAASKDGKK